MVNDYGLRGTFGLDYDLNPCNTVGVFYQTRMDFDFPNAVRFNDVYNDLLVSQPETVGLGVANSSLMDGNLLIAADVYYKLWENAPLWDDVYVNQWAFAVGAQLTRGRLKYRLGYSYNTNPINHSVGSNLDGFPGGPGRRPTVPGVEHGHDQPAPHHGRHRLARVPGPDARSGPLRRRDVQRRRPVWRLAGVGGPVLRRHGSYLALRRLFEPDGIDARSILANRHLQERPAELPLPGLQHSTIHVGERLAKIARDYRQKRSWTISDGFKKRPADNRCQRVLEVGGNGLEQPPKSSENTPFSKTGGAESGAVGARKGATPPALTALVAGLTLDDRQLLAAMLAEPDGEAGNESPVESAG